MRKSVALIAAAALFFVTASPDKPASAVSMAEYGLLLSLIAIATTTVYKSSLPEGEKQHLLHTIQAWKSLPPTKENVAYVKNMSAQIKGDLARRGMLKSTTKRADSKKVSTAAAPSIHSPMQSSNHPSGQMSHSGGHR